MAVSKMLTVSNEWNAESVCASCRYFVPRQRGVGEMASTGVCHRNPPITDDGQPVVARDGWCGEYHANFIVMHMT